MGDARRELEVYANLPSTAPGVAAMCNCAIAEIDWITDERDRAVVERDVMQSKIDDANARFGHFAGMFHGDTSNEEGSPAVLLSDLAKIVREAADTAKETGHE